MNDSIMRGRARVGKLMDSSPYNAVNPRLREKMNEGSQIPHLKCQKDFKGWLEAANG